MISAAALQASEAFRLQFQTAKPFRHVVIDDFLEPSACEALLRDFPAFNEKYAADEHGGVGRKAVVERAASISPFYRSFHDYINSAPFLGAMSALTGIDDLISDPTLFGGGTHENLAGQGLNVHVDFNIDERRMLHRRVNLLIYLNKEWDETWGGAIELHFDVGQQAEPELAWIETRDIALDIARSLEPSYTLKRRGDAEMHLARELRN